MPARQMMAWMSCTQEYMKQISTVHQLNVRQPRNKNSIRMTQMNTCDIIRVAMLKPINTKRDMARTYLSSWCTCSISRHLANCGVGGYKAGGHWHIPPIYYYKVCIMCVMLCVLCVLYVSCIITLLSSHTTSQYLHYYHTAHSIIIIQLQIIEMSAITAPTLLPILSATLSPHSIQSATSQLSSLTHRASFLPSLLIIADDSQHPIDIRLAALVYLKNVLQEGKGDINDIAIIKQSIFQALVRNIQNPKLTPTFRQIIYVMASKYLPNQWNNIIPLLSSNLTNCTSFGELSATILALKAIYSYFGHSIIHEISLNNICNQTMIPLLSLTSKLFQNFNDSTSELLIGVLKIFSTVIYFHLPDIIKCNIHSWMIFVKKVLELDGDGKIFQMKKICMRIIFRIYQRHTNSKACEDKAFALQFHHKFTRAFVDTLLSIVMKSNQSKSQFYLCKLALSCLAYIYREHPPSAELLKPYRVPLLTLLFSLHARPASSFSSAQARIHLKHDRVHMMELIFALLSDKSPDDIAVVMGVVAEAISKGGQAAQVGLYVVSMVATQLEYAQQSIQNQLVQFICTTIKGLLAEGNIPILRARACEVISAYHYVALKEADLGDIASLIYGCLICASTQQLLPMKLSAPAAFNSLLKYPSILTFVEPHLPTILKQYVKLLQFDIGVSSCLQGLIQVAANGKQLIDIIQMLDVVFRQYWKIACTGNNNNNTYNASTANQEQEDDDDDNSDVDQPQTNYQSAAKACLSALRSLLSILPAPLPHFKSIPDLLTLIFLDSECTFLEEGLNILNLWLYKDGSWRDVEGFIWVMIYAISGIPPQISNLISNASYNNACYNTHPHLLKIIANVCIEPDIDIVDNAIGPIRNFIAKVPIQQLSNIKSIVQQPMIEHLLSAVLSVHTGQNTTQSVRLTILTIVISLLEWGKLTDQQVKDTIGKIKGLLCLQRQTNQMNFKAYIYSMVYLQICMIGVHFYPEATLSVISPHQLVQSTLILAPRLHCDYQFGRVLIGLADLFSLQIIQFDGVPMLMNNVIELVRKAGKLREEDIPQSVSSEDEAEEDRLFGEDENTHINAWNTNANAIEDEEDTDWQEQFNKFYDSSLDNIDQLEYLKNALMGNGIKYVEVIDQKAQEQLSLLLTQFKPKPK